MLFALICRDRPGALSLRMDTRPAHLAYLEATGGVHLAGPLIEDDAPTGSLIVIEAESLAQARDWAANDPYALAGLFASVEVVEWRKVIG